MCEFCSNKNKRTNDIKSCFCTKCNRKNELIEMIISGMTDKERNRNEQEWLDYMKKKGTGYEKNFNQQYR